MLIKVSQCRIHSAIKVFGKIGYILKREDGYTYIDLPYTCIRIPNNYTVDSIQSRDMVMSKTKIVNY